MQKHPRLRMAGLIATPLIAAYAAFFGLRGIDLDSKYYSKEYCLPECSSYEIIKETKHLGLLGLRTVEERFGDDQDALPDYYVSGKNFYYRHGSKFAFGATADITTEIKDGIVHVTFAESEKRSVTRNGFTYRIATDEEMMEIERKFNNILRQLPTDDPYLGSIRN